MNHLIKIKSPKKLYMEDYIQDFREEMNNMLQSAFHDFGFMEPLKEKLPETAWRPAVELTEQKENYILKVEMPGINKDNIDVEIGEDAITIKAESKEEFEEKGENIYRSEFRYGKFSRLVPLPSIVDNTRAKAEYKNGVLKITVPKSIEEQKKITKIKPD